jgi:hypothetical protein
MCQVEDAALARTLLPWLSRPTIDFLVCVGMARGFPGWLHNSGNFTRAGPAYHYVLAELQHDGLSKRLERRREGRPDDECACPDRLANLLQVGLAPLLHYTGPTMSGARMGAVRLKEWERPV